MHFNDGLQSNPYARKKDWNNIDASIFLSTDNLYSKLRVSHACKVICKVVKGSENRYVIWQQRDA